jgi:23S rRNA pseudouridine1911/1915/1917 synthase
MRLDQYLAEYYPEKSRSQWQKYIIAGLVTVNGEVANTAKHTLGEDDEVAFTESKAPLKTFDVPVIYEDNNVLVLYKPAGMLTHAKGGILDEQTIADIIKPHTSYAAETNRPGIVHRLDRDTSGVIITVKNPDTAKLLQKQFTNRTIKKTYVALTDGVPKHHKARIDLPIQRNPKLPSQFRVGARGKHAMTEYEVVIVSGHYACLKLFPHTGRTHQLRVHTQYINTPILGDKVYGKQSDRLYLHAYQIEVTLPGGKRTVFTAPLPQSFSEKIGQEIRL